MSRDALVVGINIYQNKKLKNLTSPAADAEAIAQMLANYGDFDVVRRLPEAIDNENQPMVGKTLAVRLKELKQALVQLFKPEGKHIPETALFYFSGHGLRNTLGISEGFLATSDSHPDLEFYGLSMKWLRQLLEESPIRQQVIWLDCCHSGQLLIHEANPGNRGLAKDRCFIASSREFDGSWSDLNSPYSVMTKALLIFLRQIFQEHYYLKQILMALIFLRQFLWEQIYLRRILVVQISTMPMYLVHL